jgi:CysZ protein
LNNFLTDNPLTRFSTGFSYPFKAFRFINRHPRLYLFVLTPLLITIAVFSFFISLGIDLFQRTIVHYIPQGDAWYWHLISSLLWIIAVLLTTVLIFFAFTAVGNLIASPFNDLLSEKTEEILADYRNEMPFSVRRVLADAWKILLIEARKISIFLAGMALLLLLNVLPVLGSFLYGVLSIFWTILFLAVEYTGYVFSRRLLSYASQRRIIFANFSLFFGFGTGIFCILAIPFVQFFCIPLGVVGATCLVHDKQLLPAESIPPPNSPPSNPLHLNARGKGG